MKQDSAQKKLVQNKHHYTTELSSSQRKALKGLAHSLKPVVQVGNAGLSETVLKEIASALDTHELVKIQLPGQNSAEEKTEGQSELLSNLPKHTHFVSRIGRMVILYLEKEPEKARIVLRHL